MNETWVKTKPPGEIEDSYHGGPVPEPIGDRAVIPYDPKITFKKMLIEAAVTSAVLAGLAFIAWAGVEANTKLIIDFVIAHSGMSGVVASIVVPALIRGSLKALGNYLKTKNGVWYERRQDVREGAEGPALAAGVDKKREKQLLEQIPPVDNPRERTGR